MIECVDMKINRTTKSIIYVIVAAVLLCCLSGCTSWDNFKKAFIDKKPAELPVIRIAVLEPQSGDMEEAAKDELNGIMLANEVYGIVRNHRVELVPYDDQSDVDATTAQAKAITESDAVMVIGSYGNLLSLAAGDVFRELEMPAVAASCSNALVTQSNPFYISANTTDTYDALAAAEFAAKFIKAKNAAALYFTGNDFSKAKADTFAQRFSESMGNDAVQTIAIPADAEDFNDFFETLDQHDTELIYFPEEFEQAQNIVREAGTLGFDFKWTGPASWENMGIEGTYYTPDYIPENQSSNVSEAFMKAFRAKYGKEAVPSKSFALGFDAYLLAVEGIRSAITNDDRTKIAAAMKAIENLPAATGEITIAGDGSARKPVCVYIITETGASREAFRCTPEK